MTRLIQGRGDALWSPRSGRFRRRIGQAGAVLFAAAFALSACRPSLQPFAGAGLKKGEGVKMAILPFENLSKTTGAGRSMESFVLVEFLKHAPVKIVDPGEVAAILSKERVRLATSIPKETLVALGQGLGVDLVMMGTVHDFDVQLAGGAGGAGQVQVVAVSLRILDATSGEIVWAGNAARSGNDRETVFGIGRAHSLNDLAEETAAQFAEAFAASLKE